VRSFPLAFVVLGVSQHVFDIANLLSEADTRDDSIVVAANVEDVPVIVDIDRVQGLSQVVETLEIVALNQLPPSLQGFACIRVLPCKLDETPIGDDSHPVLPCAFTATLLQLVILSIQIAISVQIPAADTAPAETHHLGP
jgi:hypothetical protein